ncbi:protein TIFY 6B isoform X2 [Jatropha curcas]|uniref:protein TIFY 6B isoform X2 n=1 Tax=Jatropha curcas TaxID=180498 RepID=UPI0005FC0C84|nr:protein TIFY 6B isoform X2 [Jatropha curcas]
MERDFLGLNSKEPLAVVKEEVNSDAYKEIGFSKGSGIHWPFSNKVSALPHLNSFKVALEDKTKRIVSDSLASPGFLSISTADASDPSQRQFMPEIQKSFNHDRQGGSHFTLTAYPAQHEVHSVHHPLDVKMFPVSNHGSLISMANPFFKNYYATSSQNMVGNTTKPQLLGGIPVTTPQTIIPTIGSVTGMMDSCAKSSGSPAQLTIFYAGTVNVYDDISPEKAQAILFLAGNGSSISSNMAQPKIQVQAPSSKPIATDISPVSQPVTTPPCSCLSSPLSVSSHTGAQSGSGSTSTEEILTAKSTGTTTPVSKLESPRIASTMGSVAATTMIPSVPQARKASLARFLEKRKERVMSAAPYSLCKKSPESITQNPVD